MPHHERSKGIRLTGDLQPLNAASQLKLSVDFEALEMGQAGVHVYGLTSEAFDLILTHTNKGGDLSCLFRVRVMQSQAEIVEDLPDVAGRYQLLEQALRFAPFFPFERGIAYRATLDLRSLGASNLSEVLSLDFTLADRPVALPSQVLGIYPSSDSLPENVLRFYVHFSNSMQRGCAENEIVLLDSDGEEVTDVLYRPPIELWDRGMRILTVLLDPGRLKRALGPNRILGPPLTVHQTYILSIGAGLLDFQGRPMPGPASKRFRVIEAARERVAVEDWRLSLPRTGTREALVLTFPSPLDWSLLTNSIVILSSDGHSIDGRITIDQHESRWTFLPASDWASGQYQVRVAGGLEDICGNSTAAAFDTPLRADGGWNNTAAPLRLFSI